MRGDRERLLDIKEAIIRIERHTPAHREAFEADELVQVWVLHHLQIIGEASRALSDEMKARYAEVPWSDIVGMRNIIVHVYFGIDTDLVWAVLERDLQPLKQTVIRALDGSKG